jgi:hypothetical protein
MHFDLHAIVSLMPGEMVCTENRPNLISNYNSAAVHDILNVYCEIIPRRHIRDSTSLQSCRDCISCIRFDASWKSECDCTCHKRYDRVEERLQPLPFAQFLLAI